MKQITINIPDNCELKQDGNNYTIVEKEKLNYDDVVKKLFDGKTIYWIGTLGTIKYVDNLGDELLSIPDNASTRKQLEKLLAINKLMNVAKYLNGDWQPDWDYLHENKYYIYIRNKQIEVDYEDTVQCNDIYFKSKELAKQAIKILGEEIIKLALCTDY